MNLEINSRYIITDSGGLQEEACILGVLCITIRENTERLETVSVGANILVGCDKEKLINALNHKFVDKWDQPFGFGDTAKKILDIICPDSKDKNLEEKKEEITVVGLGYMGLPTALLLSKLGYKVRGFHIDKNKVDSINLGISFDEKDLLEMLKESLESKRFIASTKYNHQMFL